MRALWRALRLPLAAFGAFLWVMLWWQRHPLLGIIQGVLLSYLLWRELRTEPSRERGNDLPSDRRDPFRRP